MLDVGCGPAGTRSRSRGVASTSWASTCRPSSSAGPRRGRARGLSGDLRGAATSGTSPFDGEFDAAVCLCQGGFGLLGGSDDEAGVSPGSPGPCARAAGSRSAPSRRLRASATSRTGTRSTRHRGQPRGATLRNEDGEERSSTSGPRASRPRARAPRRGGRSGGRRIHGVRPGATARRRRRSTNPSSSCSHGGRKPCSLNGLVRSAFCNPDRAARRSAPDRRIQEPSPCPSTSGQPAAETPGECGAAARRRPQPPPPRGTPRGARRGEATSAGHGGRDDASIDETAATHESSSTTSAASRFSDAIDAHARRVRRRRHRHRQGREDRLATRCCSTSGSSPRASSRPELSIRNDVDPHEVVRSTRSSRRSSSRRRTRTVG